MALCIATASAVQESSEDQTEQHRQQAPFDASPIEISDDQMRSARQGIKDILAMVPIQTVEPLFSTMDGYCKAFSAVCTLACEERGQSTFEPKQAPHQDRIRKRKYRDQSENQDTDEDHVNTIRATGSCAHPEAKSVVHAQAICQCAGYDLTDRVNFAVVGGVVTSKRSSSGDFKAEGFLDGLTFLPKSPFFMTIINVMQSFCGYVSVFSNIAIPQPVPAVAGPALVPSAGGEGVAAGAAGGSVAGIVTGGGEAALLGGIAAIAQLIPGVGAVSNLIPLVPVLGGLLNGSLKAPVQDGPREEASISIQPPTPISTESATTTSNPVTSTRTTTPVNAATKPSANPTSEPKPPLTPTTALPPTTEKKPNNGGILGWLTHWFMGTDSRLVPSANQPDINVQDDYEGYDRHQVEDEDEKEKTGLSRLVSRDGRVAKITRIQRRQNKKTGSWKQKDTL
ncbi:hypothetical protein BGX31_009516 [Mortierella sp. GBA43]|nr:hypothetical protein BGX31_009516 [Mortierella sp. GBA43]